MSSLVPAVSAATVARVEKAMYQCIDLAELPVTHYVGDVKGVYLREGKIPRGKYVLGHRHNTRHYMVLFSGVMKMLDGDAVVTVKGPCVLVCEPHQQKLAYVVEDIHGLNIMATQLTDLAAIEEELVVKSDLHREWLALVADNKPALLQ